MSLQRVLFRADSRPGLSEIGYLSPLNSSEGDIVSLSDLASLGSFVSGFAVLVSLVFLYFQLKQINAQVVQAERNQQAATRAVRTSRIVEIMIGTTEPSLADAIAKGRAGSADITDTQIRQFFAYSNARFYNAQDTFQQFRQGLLDNTILESLVDGLKVSLSHPGTRAFFENHRTSFGVEFVKFVQGLAAETPLNVSSDAADRWRTDVGALRARA
jgi:hypothetical protein